MLTIEHYSKTYRGGKRAVDDLSLTVAPGEIFGFIGHNGAGKTTTLRAVAGILDFSEGTITIDGHDIRREPIAAKQVTAFLPDNPDLYDFLKGIDYLTFIADLYGIPQVQRQERIAKYADAFELTGNLGSAIGSYSHGMKQKLQIIGSLIHQPRIWILDEPMVGLDPASMHALKEEMRAYCESGRTVFFSTHVLDVAERLCDEIGIIRHGKLIAKGAPETLMRDDRANTLEDLFLNLTEKEG